MKVAKSVLIGLVVLVFLVLAAGAYYYRGGMLAPAGSNQLPPTAHPDNSIIAGPIKALSDTSITITKQDGTTATFAIGTSTRIVIEAGQTSTGPSALATGKTALITPDATDSTMADTIIIASPPPQQ